jgi:hypothetical protein
MSGLLSAASLHEKFSLVRSDQPVSGSFLFKANNLNFPQ